MSAIFPDACEIVGSRFYTSINDISASTGPSDPSFGDVICAVPVYVHLKFHVDWSQRSLGVRRGFEPCRRWKTEYKVLPFDRHISASSGATELRLREDIPAEVFRTCSKGHLDLSSRS